MGSVNNEPDAREEDFRNDYMLLGRLESDCKYFLGNGNGHEGHLWAGSVEDQIAKMKELWDKFPDDLKPEWITSEDIEDYERNMRQYAAESMTGNGVQEVAV